MGILCTDRHTFKLLVELEVQLLRHELGLGDPLLECRLVQGEGGDFAQHVAVERHVADAAVTSRVSTILA